MYNFSIVTPTYNRSHLLSAIYDSLSKQMNKNIEWIIIDDGSKDNTKEVVNSFKKEFEIKYTFQENKGKPSAVNNGVKMADSFITIILDDDDVLMPNVLNIIWSYYDSENMIFKENCAALSGLCIEKVSNMIIADPFPKSIFKTDFFSLSFNRRHFGDKAHVFCTHILKQYPWPIISNEYFITESTVFHRIAADGHKVLCVNSIFVMKEYLKDGLSSKYRKIMDDNPKGSELFFNEATAIKISPYWHIRLSGHYIRFAKMNKRKNIFFNAKNKFVYPFGIIIYILLILRNLKNKDS